MRDEEPKSSPAPAIPTTSNQTPKVSKVKTAFAGRWRPFSHKSGTYDLDHLNDRTIRYEKPAQGSNPARIYNVEVEFSTHCFTREPDENEVIDNSLLYPGEKRLFCFERY